MAAYPTPQLAGAAGRFDTATHGWSRLVHWFSDSRAHRVICLVAGIWLINAFDLALTIVTHQQGLLQEQNPVARQMLEQGELSIMLYKIGLVLIGSYPLLRFRRARITELAAYVVLFAYAGLAFRWSQCVQLYSLSFSNPINLAEIEAVGAIPPQ